MKIPRKKDLLHLQQQYKTDKKIGEALGGVPEYLVSYWRRKKNIPLYSAPKFSQKEIEEAWLRHGSDFKAGRELNLSRAAFYSWRRKYGIYEKPAHLKLEQLELHFSPATVSGAVLAASRSSLPAPTTVKLWRRMAENSAKGKLLPDWFLHDHPHAAGSLLFVLSPGKGQKVPSSPPEFVEPVLARPSGNHSIWGDRSFGRSDWQLIEGRVLRPGETVAGEAADMGGLGGIAVLCLPERLSPPMAVCKVEFARHAGPRAGVEDRFLEFVGRYPPTQWQNTVLEFLGVAVERLTVDRKIKLAQLATSFGAAAALCPFDDGIRRHFPRNIKSTFIKAFPDRGAVYDKEFLLEGRPKDVHLAKYTNGWKVLPGEEAMGHPVNTVIVGPDALPYEIAYAAEVLGGRRIPRSVSLIVMPISAETVCDSRRRGWLENLVSAGASIVDPRLAARIGLATLIGRDHGDVLLTRPPQDPAKLTHPRRRLWFSGIRTAAATAVRGIITLP